MHIIGLPLKSLFWWNNGLNFFLDMYVSKHVPGKAKYFSLPEKTTAISDFSKKLYKEITKACLAAKKCECCGG
jgi:hypothetical protein